LLNQAYYQIYSQEELHNYLINKNILKTDSNEGLKNSIEIDAKKADISIPHQAKKTNSHERLDQKWLDLAQLLKHSLAIEPQKEKIISMPDQHTQANLQISLPQQDINLKSLFSAYDSSLDEPENLALFVLSCQANPIIKLPLTNKAKVELAKAYFSHNDPFLNHYKFLCCEKDDIQKGSMTIADKKHYIIEQLLTAFSHSNIKEIDEATQDHMLYIINNLPFNQMTKKPFTIEMKEYHEANKLLASEYQNKHIEREERARYPSNPPSKVPQLIIFNNKIFALNEYFFFFIKHYPHNKYMLINQAETIITFSI
jgi:hypothetical protein